MSGPKNVRCRNFNDEGVGECDSGEYCQFVHPGPRWANARPYNRTHSDSGYIPSSYRGGGGNRGRSGGGGGGGGRRDPVPRRCRYYESDGSPINRGCFAHPKGECKYTHPDQPGWDTATPSGGSSSRARNSFGQGSGSNSLPSGPGRVDSTPGFGRASVDATADTGSGFGFGTTEMRQSPQPITPSSGWGQSNEPQQPAEETSGGGWGSEWGGGWGGGNTNHGWGTSETGDTSTGWGNGGGWGSSVHASGSGGGWGSSSKNDDTAGTTQPTTQVVTTKSNPPVQTSSGSGWGSSNIAWGASDNTNTQDPPVSGWGSSGGSGTGWGSSNTNDDTTSTVRQTTQMETVNPPAQTSSDLGWGSSNTTWGSSNNTQKSPAGAWGSSGNASGSGGGGWGSSGKNNGVADTTRPIAQVETVKPNPPVQTSMNNSWDSSGVSWGTSNDTQDWSSGGWGSSGDTWGSSGWGSSNNTWGSSNEVARDEPVNLDKGKGKGRENSAQGGGRSGWRKTSTCETTTGLLPSGGMGWGNSTPAVSATAGVTQGSTPATTRLDAVPTVMDVDEGEPNFEGKAAFTALENIVHKRKSKRKRSNEDFRQFPRYYRHLLTSQHTAGSGVDFDGDTVMDGVANQPAREGSLEVGEIAEVPPDTKYDMNVLSREPRTSEEKTTYAKHLLHIFTEAAVAADRKEKADKRYEDYKKSQEARMYNHPGNDARQVLMNKLLALRTTSNKQNEHLERITADLESLPSHNLSEVIAYNEHNHLTEAEEKRKAAIDEVVRKWDEKHDLVDQNLLTLQARLEELEQEKKARETFRDLPTPVDHDRMAIEGAETVHQANIQRAAVVEVSVQTITFAESMPHRDGPIQTLEESLPTVDSQALQLQEFAEGIAKLIQQTPVVREAALAIQAGNEARKAAEEAHEQSMRDLSQQLATSSAQLKELNTWVTGLVEGLRHQVTMENVKSAIRPVLREQTRAVIEDVHEYVERGLGTMRELIQQEQAQLEGQVYLRLVGTQRLFEAVGCYLRSVNADLASVHKDGSAAKPP